jgi:pyruvate kinase
MGIARLNGSHSDFAWHANAIAMLREAVPEVPILLDLPGRKVRMRHVEIPVAIAASGRVVLTSDTSYGGTDKIVINEPNMVATVNVGDRIRVDDGRLLVTIVEIDGQDIIGRAENAGLLQGAKGVHIPGLRQHKEFLSDADRKLIAFAKEHDVDFVGLSFVDSKDEVLAARDVAGESGPSLVAKIETQGAMDDLRGILSVADAIMIDRGDLSVETNMEQVALFQKRILAEARLASCPAIVATELLHSMTHDMVPTKAEVSDMTNSVLDQASALMLSGETAIGEYPLEAIAVMRAVADGASAFLQSSAGLVEHHAAATVPEAMGEAIELICRRLPITKIIAVTISGFAARIAAAHMPRQPVLAVTNNPRTARRFNLYPGTTGYYIDIPFSRTSMDHVPECLRHLWQTGDLLDDDMILVTAVGYPTSGNRMNLIETHVVSDLKQALRWEME